MTFKGLFQPKLFYDSISGGNGSTGVLGTGLEGKGLL